MNYPLISEYIEAIKAAEDNFNELSYLRPVLGDDGLPVMTSGNFAVVFKMKDEQSGKLYAVKCFTKEQEGRAERYKLIADELEFVSSNFLSPIKFLEKELYVDTSQSEESEFPVLLMDWIEGKTLDVYIREHAEEKYIQEMLAFRFCQLASWLLSQPFAHGDLKPDNILVKEDGKLVLVDYDGMYVPSMKGQKAKEIGSPGFRHPKRTEDIFNDNIDDFSIALISMSLKAFALNKDLIDKYCSSESFFFKESDLKLLNLSQAMPSLIDLSYDEEFCSLFGVFMIAHSNGNLSLISSKLLSINNPKNGKSYEDYVYNQVIIDYFRSNTDHKKAFALYEKAFTLFQKAAEAGDTNGMWRLGECYYYGIGVEKNREEVFRWYKKAAEAGDSFGMCRLGECYEDGIGVEKNKLEAFRWYKKAAEAGDTNGMWRLGFCYEIGLGVGKNELEAFRWCEKAAETGNSEGMWRLGEHYYHGIGVAIDELEAVRWYKKAAEAEGTNGMCRLGERYCYGIGVEKNAEEAFRWYEKAAEAGNSDGMLRLGFCYYYGKGVAIDKLEAVRWYKKAAEAGDSEGMWRLGECYYYGYGKGVEKNEVEAVRWYKKAAEAGDSYGMRHLGKCYEDGIGVEKNAEEAVRWFQKAEEKEAWRF